jgi:hypothetical protein
MVSKFSKKTIGAKRMNPIIEAASTHIAEGDKVIQIFIDDEEADVPQGVTIRLHDGRDFHHLIVASDHREFYQWYREASDWLIKSQSEKNKEARGR